MGTFTVLSGFGLLTHYQFVVWWSGSLLAIAVAARMPLGRLVPRLALAAAAATSMFLLAFPVWKFPGRLRAVGHGGVVPIQRLALTVESLAGFTTQYAQIGAVGQVVLWLAVIALILAVRRVPMMPVPTAGHDLRRAATVLLLWVAVGIFTGYVSGVFPVHAMGNKYLSLVWVGMALGAVGLTYRVQVAHDPLGCPRIHSWRFRGRVRHSLEPLGARER